MIDWILITPRPFPLVQQKQSFIPDLLVPLIWFLLSVDGVCINY